MKQFVRGTTSEDYYYLPELPLSVPSRLGMGEAKRRRNCCRDYDVVKSAKGCVPTSTVAFYCALLSVPREGVIDPT